jgi:hypothetical protein
MRKWKYFKMVAASNPVELEGQAYQQLLRFVESLRERKRSSPLPAGYTYLGQLIDHDLTHMRSHTLPANVDKFDIDNIGQDRKPALDLDCIYGAGLDDSVVPYDLYTGKFLFADRSSLFHSLKRGSRKDRDFLRDKEGRPRIADIRNDENLLVAQMQILFMKLHNKIVDYFILFGYRGADQLFEAARAEVARIYQYVVLHDFARKILPDHVYETVIKNNEGVLTHSRKNFPSISVEFVAAAYRLHSMVKKGYKLSTQSGKVSLTELFEWTGNGQGKPFLLPEDRIVDWELFFELDDNHEKTINRAEPLSPSVTHFSMPIQKFVNLMNAKQNAMAAPSSAPQPSEVLKMAEITLKRGEQLGLASGQQVRKSLQKKQRGPSRKILLSNLNDEVFEGLPLDNPFRTNTPLWLYIMLEAGSDANPQRLGEVGGWLVADTLRATALNSRIDIYPDWQPKDSVLYPAVLRNKAKYARNRITMADVVKFINAE